MKRVYHFDAVAWQREVLWSKVCGRNMTSTRCERAPDVTVRGNTTKFVGLTEMWINRCHRVHPMSFLISPCCCVYFHSKARGRKNVRDLRGDHWERREWWIQRHVLAHLCALGESTNDLWHMVNFSDGIDHFLIRMVPLMATTLGEFPLLVEMTDAYLQKTPSYSWILSSQGPRFL